VKTYKIQNISSSDKQNNLPLPVRVKHLAPKIHTSPVATPKIPLHVDQHLDPEKSREFAPKIPLHVIQHLDPENPREFAPKIHCALKRVPSTSPADFSSASSGALFFAPSAAQRQVDTYYHELVGLRNNSKNAEYEELKRLLFSKYSFADAYREDARCPLLTPLVVAARSDIVFEYDAFKLLAESKARPQNLGAWLAKRSKECYYFSRHLQSEGETDRSQFYKQQALLLTHLVEELTALKTRTCRFQIILNEEEYARLLNMEKANDDYV